MFELQRASQIPDFVGRISCSEWLKAEPPFDELKNGRVVEQHPLNPGVVCIAPAERGRDNGWNSESEERLPVHEVRIDGIRRGSRGGATWSKKPPHSS